jgi:hypothetical protein
VTVEGAFLFYAGASAAAVGIVLFGILLRLGRKWGLF